MSLTINAKTYTSNSFGPNKVGYVGPGKTATIKDDFSIATVAPKSTPVFSGVARSEGKLTRTLTLTNAVTSLADAIARFEVSVPVGYTAADVDTILNDFGALIASAAYKDIVKKQLISF